MGEALLLVNNFSCDKKKTKARRGGKRREEGERGRCAMCGADVEPEKTKKKDNFLEFPSD